MNPPRFKFAGRELDQLNLDHQDNEVNLYQDRARYYDPASGRFISQDPIGFAGGDGNLYRYVGNNASNATDPTGLADGPPSLPGNPGADWGFLDYVYIPFISQHYLRQESAHLDAAISKVVWTNLYASNAKDPMAAALTGAGPLTAGRFPRVGGLNQGNGRRAAAATWQMAQLAAEAALAALLTHKLSVVGDEPPVACPAIDAAASRLPWTSWANARKAVLGGREYAQIGGRFYTQHAVERMMPSGLSAYGRSIAPAYVEEAIATGTATTRMVDGVIRTTYVSGTLAVVTENGGAIVVTIVNRR